MEPAKADREYPLGEIIIKTGKESQKHMVDTRTDELYRALQDKGYPDELCREIAYKHMNTDYTATRMLGYLYRVTSPRVEDVIDEMLAILSDREASSGRKSWSTPRLRSTACIGRVCNGNPGAVPVLADQKLHPLRKIRRSWLWSIISFRRNSSLITTSI